LEVSSGVYRPSDATFYLKRTNESGGADAAILYGILGDRPTTGDWDGDGIDTIGVCREGVFFLRSTNTQGPADRVFAFGLPGDMPIAGDWTDKGYDSIGVYRPSDSTFYLKNTNASGYADAIVPFGIPGDQPVVGDWDNDGMDAVGVYRGSEFFLWIADQVQGFWLGTIGDVHLAGNWGLAQEGGGESVAGGELLWAKQVARAGYCIHSAIAADAADNRLVIGAFGHSGGSHAAPVVDETLLAKHAPDGLLLGLRQLAGTSTTSGSAVAVDAAGNSLVTGWFGGLITLGAGEPNETVLTAAVPDMFVAKYAP
jgi:hypothetical protein